MNIVRVVNTVNIAGGIVGIVVESKNRGIVIGLDLDVVVAVKHLVDGLDAVVFVVALEMKVEIDLDALLLIVRGVVVIVAVIVVVVVVLVVAVPVVGVVEAAFEVVAGFVVAAVQVVLARDHLEVVGSKVDLLIGQEIV